MPIAVHLLLNIYIVVRRLMPFPWLAELKCIQIQLLVLFPDGRHHHHTTLLYMHCENTNWPRRCGVGAQAKLPHPPNAAFGILEIAHANNGIWKRCESVCSWSAPCIRIIHIRNASASAILSGAPTNIHTHTHTNYSHSPQSTHTSHSLQHS